MLQLLALVFSFVSVTEVHNPRPTHWVTDQADILDIGTEDKLNTLAETLYRTKQIELAVVVLDDVRETPKQFATKLFNHWKIGNAQTNTGVLVLLVMKKRRLEIETGTGIEAALPSAWLADMQAEKMVPRFKQKDFPGGLVAGVQAIVDHIGAAPGEGTTEQKPGEYRDNGKIVDPTLPNAPLPNAGEGSSPGLSRPHEPPEEDDGPPVGPLDEHQAVSAPPDEDDGPPVGPLAAGGAGLVGLGGGAALLARHRRRQRTCTKCQPNRAMLPLSEVEDDQHLDAGERKEEQLKSVDYEVVICPGCQDARTFRHNKWFSGHSTCSSCSYKTLSSRSTTTVQATYDHGGEVEVTEDCRHCNHHYTYTRYTSALTRSDSSSSSSSGSSFSSGGGGGSFGGGSSSGGGAGSSW